MVVPICVTGIKKNQKKFFSPEMRLTKRLEIVIIQTNRVKKMIVIVNKSNFNNNKIKVAHNKKENYKWRF